MDPYERKENDSEAEVIWNRTTVTPKMRSAAKKQRSLCIWFTGLSGSGKSTLANALEAELFRQGYHTMLVDGDNVRHGLCKDLCMSDASRSENIRRVAEVAKLLVDAGVITIAAFISPFASDRAAARALFAEGDFFEVHVATPLAECEQRDPKGLYRKVREGVIKDFTGVDSPYETPLAPECVVGAQGESIRMSIIQLLGLLSSRIKDREFEVDR
ncbi:MULTISPECIES: adenylyl-sulfate kinase [Pseudomonas]|uniref:Adenylyl-sulfate kinase n=1 Tax=Pseudomonas mosselii TaxID=78327 RepID=A0A5R8Z8E1_9PSED|nr:adenylyl-sulfate kinase [Pseudomonas mosselii]TLP61166.1 adenylyl-sulfate kinase [Pseudomonas mosselii]